MKTAYYEATAITTNDHKVAEAIKGLNDEDKELIARTIASLRGQLNEALATCDKLELEKKCLYEIVIDKTERLLNVEVRDDEEESNYNYNQLYKKLKRE